MSIQPFWGSGFTQKRAQSPGNHIAVYKKNLDQKFGLDKKLEQFSEKKVRHPTFDPQDQPNLIENTVTKIQQSDLDQ